MKRILSISPWPSVWSQGRGGGSPSEGYAIQAMVKAGFHVTHLSPFVDGLAPVEEEDCIRFVRISPNPFDKLRIVLKTGFAVLYRLPAIAMWTSLVSRWLRQSGERFDLVVGHSSETIFALRRAACRLGVPGISRLYGVSATPQRLSRGIRRELYFDLLSLLRHPPDRLIITDDGTCGDEICGIFKIPPAKFDFLLNGFEPSILSLESIDHSPGYVLAAGRLVDWKRMDRVIRIAGLLYKRIPELNFVILGDGPDRNSLERLVQKLGVSSCVTLTGSVSRSKMYEYLRGASVVLSTQDLSNLTNTVLEALVMGRPVVALDSGCSGKLLHHEKTCLLYPVQDIQAAATGIERLLNDETLRKRLGSNARSFSRGILKPWPQRIADEAAIYGRF